MPTIPLSQQPSLQEINEPSAAPSINIDIPQNINMAVMEEPKEWGSITEKPPPPWLLLSAIVQCFPDGLDPTLILFKAARSLLEQDQSLKEKLEKAWRTEDFGEVRQYPSLQAVSAPVSARSSSSVIGRSAPPATNDSASVRCMPTRSLTLPH
ncbi:hypothetical protein BOTBODRAFT_55448 [Botryobasidium botryosum FD-172 SS1]|uniref:Uncharacterized protein n=1 Tax=Botryobasidium botryosum (strain FD-172 SS1) TaxID=930990 RepID=A0A067MFD2_BOTB1|nr:hypothetical protein BOTBODRAFT_55448 [Botryobasidium botryosum FD-172 SS1]